MIYFLSFQWIRDLVYLPILVPQISSTILKENYFLDTPLSNFFTLLEIPSYESNRFILGFLNSFFLALPLSTSHFISARRLLVQGVPAGIASSFGTIIGQSFFFLLCFVWFTFIYNSLVFIRAFDLSAWCFFNNKSCLRNGS